MLSRRASAATPVARRQLVPVLVGGKIALLLFALGLALGAALVAAPGSSASGSACSRRSRCRSPSSACVLQGRLSGRPSASCSSSCASAASALTSQDALRRALGDPSLELGRARPEDGATSTAPGGRSRFPAAATRRSRRRSCTRARRSARSSTTARCACARSCSTPSAPRPASRSRTSARSRRCSGSSSATAPCSTRSPITMIRVARDGTYLDVRPDDHVGPGCAPAEELIGRNVPRRPAARARRAACSRASSARSRAAP